MRSPFSQSYLVLGSWLLLLLAACQGGVQQQEGQSNSTNATNATKKDWGSDYFRLRFIQEGQLLPLENSRVRLHKAPFSIHFEIRELKGLFLHTCPDSTPAYINMKEIAANDLLGKTMASSPSNEDYELILHCDALNYLRQSNDAYRTFNRAQQKGTELEALLEVHNLYYAEEETTIRVEDVEEDLLLTFLALNNQEAAGFFNILQQQTIQISWQ
ncbi:MAG: hypothetical protein AAFP19_11945 [Bacteroidota bacterium]